MFPTCKNKIWITHIPDLFCDYSLIPMAQMTLEEKINALTRLSVLIFIILLLSGVSLKKSLVIHVIILVVLISFYYLSKKLVKESYDGKEVNEYHTFKEYYGNKQRKENYNPNNANEYHSFKEYYDNNKGYNNNTREDVCPNCTDYTKCRECTDNCYLVNPKQEHNLCSDNQMNNVRQQMNMINNIPKYMRTGPLRFDDAAPINCSSISANANLSGQANPKTKIAPLIVPKSHDLEYWKTNNLVVMSNINEETNQDVYQSGFFPLKGPMMNDCDPKYGPTYKPVCGYNNVLIENDNDYPKDSLSEDNNIKNGKLIESYCLPANMINNDFDLAQMKKNNVKESYGNPNKENYCSSSFTPKNSYSKEYYTEAEYKMVNDVLYDNQQQRNYDFENKELFTMDLNLYQDNNTYDSNSIYNADSSYDSCNCDYTYLPNRNNIITQTIQPGIYSKNDVLEPISSTIGISYDQQFEPLTVQTKNNRMMFEQHDPSFSPVVISDNSQDIDIANVYDPRFSGYGSCNRSYIDDVTGQPRFAYDDVNAIRMPNFIIRSNVDNLPFADAYGPYPESNVDNSNCDSYRSAVNDSFLNNSLQFRTELQERLMRKKNADMWQRRLAPISTSNQRMLGSNGSKAL